MMGEIRVAGQAVKPPGGAGASTAATPVISPDPKAPAYKLYNPRAPCRSWAGRSMTWT
jgi:hypothetical protein